jgi:hypothetical protein
LPPRPAEDSRIYKEKSIELKRYAVPGSKILFIFILLIIKKQKNKNKQL